MCQIHPPYLKYLIQYNKILLQRNSLLKITNETGNLDALLLETLNEQLIASGNPIHEYRKQLMQEWLPEVLNLYQHLAGQADYISIKYQSTLSDQYFKSLLVQSLAKDTLLHRTNVGIHKDDLVVTIQNQPFKQEASQGQRKSLLFAIRLLNG